MLCFAHEQHGKAPTDFQLTDLSAKFLLGFLDHLEQQRQNSVRIPNVRLAAVRSFLNYCVAEFWSKALSTLPELLALSVAVPPVAALTIGRAGAALSSGERPLVPAALLAVTV